MMLIEIESLAARDRYQPDSGPTAEGQELNQSVGGFWARWQQLAEMSPAKATIFTDYVVIE